MLKRYTREGLSRKVCSKEAPGIYIYISIQKYIGTITIEGNEAFQIIWKASNSNLSFTLFCFQRSAFKIMKNIQILPVFLSFVRNSGGLKHFPCFKYSLVSSIFSNCWISRNFSVIWVFIPFLGHLIIRPMYTIILYKHMSRKLSSK